MRVFEELRGLGYAGGYDAVRRYAARWQRERAVATAAAFVPLSFAPDEAYQFDWSHEGVPIAGVYEGLSFVGPGWGYLTGWPVQVLIDLDGDSAADMRMILLDTARLGPDDFLL